MSQIQSGSWQNCVLLAVRCGKFAEKQQTPSSLEPEPKRVRPSYPFPELVSSGRLEVHTLINPSVEQFGEAQQAVQPNLLYLQGQQLENGEIGSLAWGDTDLSDPQTFCSLISPPFPTIEWWERREKRERGGKLISDGKMLYLPSPTVLCLDSAASARSGSRSAMAAAVDLDESASSRRRSGWEMRWCSIWGWPWQEGGAAALLHEKAA
nr:unnamed protein product [Digitaria exilis]